MTSREAPAQTQSTKKEKSTKQTSTDHIQLNGRASESEKNTQQLHEMDATEMERMKRLNPDILRDQDQKFHPNFAAQNILTGAGKPILSPLQQKRILIHLNQLQNIKLERNRYQQLCFDNEAFIDTEPTGKSSTSNSNTNSLNL
ncbi:Oidioi.mRNA.OKI2018_I69.chr2.g6073.t1.cds [Oikopleura dioica]|uniref:Oidioi.mRNA.OKI2018_I69.chr2.g6073.t1.cds n=1 Tax=Oikopleura dioica TaxID=34765 RepID=A0ABN7T1U7_OIKDI|nr:Oidioi.mRNA.OKI2018_I69.chr2.g6073.t1.cds [Oikopleura dioica]